jgi:hypothetical protein
VRADGVLGDFDDAELATIRRFLERIVGVMAEYRADMGTGKP